MRRALLVCLIAILPAFRVAHARADVACDLTIPATMIDKMDSAHSYPGERFRFKTTALAQFNGVTIPQDSIGWGIVRYVQGARSHNRGGLLLLEPRFLIVGASKIDVSADPRETAEFAHATTLTERAMGYLPYGIGGIVNDIRFGPNVTLGPGFTFHIVVIGDLTTNEPCKPPPQSPAPSVERRQSSPSPSPSPESR